MNRQHVVPQILLRAWPFPRGAGRIIDRFFLGLPFDEDVATVETTDAFELSVMPNDLIGRHLYLTGEFDRTIVEVLLAHAAPGDTLLDIGANVGYVSACFLAGVRGSTTLSVEPQPQVVDLLRANLRQFGARARIASVALSDRDGEGHLQVVAGNRGASRLVTAPASGTASVAVCSPGRLFQELDVRKIDLVKIDVEGHEESVFRALEPFLPRYRPRLILFEDHGTQAAPDAPIGRLLRRAGYSVAGIHKKLTRFRLVSIRSADDCRYNDYVALAD